jgi:hypothetical protein
MSCPGALEGPYPRKAAKGLIHTSLWKLKRNSLIPTVWRKQKNCPDSKSL